MMPISPILLLLIVGTILFTVSLYLLFRKGFLGIIFRVLPAVILLAVSLTLMLSGLDIMSYRELGRETSIATLHFEQRSAQTFDVILIDKQGQKLQFQLKGDHWQIDARIMRWSPELARFGFKSLYRLERIGGRYLDIQQELTKERTLYSINNQAIEQAQNKFNLSNWEPDTWQWIKQTAWLRQWVDVSYGSATYLPMVNGAIYELMIGYSGLSARPINEGGRQAVSTWQ